MTATPRPTAQQAGYPEPSKPLRGALVGRLPLIPATNALVDAMIAGGTRGARRGHRRHPGTPGHHAGLAGCNLRRDGGLPPGLLPGGAATWEAMFDPRFNLHTAISSTGGAAIARWCRAL